MSTVIYYIKDRGRNGIPETPPYPHGAYNSIPTATVKSSNNDGSSQNDSQETTKQ
ncbi:MAG: hypothetical protein WAV73_06210 [Candidatus Moraniibacteriota bacterium]